MEHIGKIINLAQQRGNMTESAQQLKSEKIVTVIERSEDEIRNICRGCGVSERFLSASIQTVDKKIWESVSKIMDGESYFIWGGAGVGKTHLVSAIINEHVRTKPDKLIKEGIREFFTCPTRPHIISVPDLLLEIRETFNTQTSDFRESKSESAIIKKYTDIKCLILDDFGAEKTTDWNLQTLYSIIDHRYRQMYQTMITSNYPLSKIGDKVGDRIASRISEMCKIINLKGKDRRLKP